jgi:hypothetical protein
MPRAWNQSEQLRGAQDKIECLRNEEEEQSLAEMAQNRNDGKGHAREVAKRIAWKDSCWVPFGSNISQCGAEERKWTHLL